MVRWIVGQRIQSCPDRCGPAGPAVGVDDIRRQFAQEFPVFGTGHENQPINVPVAGKGTDCMRQQRDSAQRPKLLGDTATGPCAPSSGDDDDSTAQRIGFLGWHCSTLSR